MGTAPAYADAIESDSPAWGEAFTTSDGVRLEWVHDMAGGSGYCETDATQNAAVSDLPRTPAPHGQAGWRETGTHLISRWLEGGYGVCACGPANHLTGPQWATFDGIEYRTAVEYIPGSNR